MAQTQTNEEWHRGKYSSLSREHPRTSRYEAGTTPTLPCAFRHFHQSFPSFSKTTNCSPSFTDSSSSPSASKSYRTVAESSPPVVLAGGGSCLPFVVCGAAGSSSSSTSSSVESRGGMMAGDAGEKCTEAPFFLGFGSERSAEGREASESS